MKRNDVIAQLNEIFRDILDNEDIELEETTTAEDVEEWDSLSHIQLVVAVEKHFNVKFTSKEIMGWNNVGDMINCIVAKQ